MSNVDVAIFSYISLSSLNRAYLKTLFVGFITCGENYFSHYNMVPKLCNIHVIPY